MELDDFSRILEQGWPEDSVMEEIPFGEQMKELGKSEDHGEHVKKVVTNMNKLLSQSPVTALCDASSADSQEDLTSFLEVWNKIQKIFKNSSMGQDRIHAFLRICAFYHDIGKIIQRDRHPTWLIGWAGFLLAIR